MCCDYKISTELTAEEQMLAEAAREASRDAVKRAFAAGLSITIARDDQLVEISPDGTEKIVGKL